MTAFEHEKRLREVVHSSAWFMGLLEAVRDCDPPDWLLGGGVLRNLVWNRLHGYPDDAHLKDVDVAYFDPEYLSREKDEAVETVLAARSPGVAWDAKNQAAVHLWYERRFGFAVPPLRSAAHGVATYPETATSVGVHLMRHDDLRVHAPCGLEDLFGLVLRRNPRRVTPEIFRRRAIEKKIVERWPKVTVIHDDPPKVEAPLRSGFDRHNRG